MEKFGTKTTITSDLLNVPRRHLGDVKDGLAEKACMATNLEDAVLIFVAR